jgi:phage gpG-like protein
MLKLEIQGLENLATTLRALLRDATREAARQAAHDLKQRIAERYFSQGALHGNPWPPRSSRRGNRRPAPTPDEGRPLLVRTGRLRSSWTDEHSPDHIETLIEEADGRLVVEIGTRVPYAPFHEAGTGRIPPRPILTPQVLQGEAVELLT